MLTVVVSAPSAAFAHTKLLGTSPAEGTVLTAPVDEVTLTFGGPIQATNSTVTVTGPDGGNFSEGQLFVVDFVVHQPVAPLTSGSYRVSWTIIAGDGDPMNGEFTFQASLPAKPTTTPATEPTPTTPTTTSPATTTDTATDASSGPSAGWWWLAAAVLAAVLITVAVIMRRGRADR